MAIKSTLFLLAFMLMNTRLMGSSVEDVHKIETKFHHLHLHHLANALIQAPTKAPAHAPEKALGHTHVQAPAKAPTHSPVKALAHSPSKAPANAPSRIPSKAPIHAPHKAPAHAPVFFTQGCFANCASYCKQIRPRRPCMRSCTICCAKLECVPGGQEKCINWDQVMIHGHMIMCP